MSGTATAGSKFVALLEGKKVGDFRYGPDRPLVVVRAHWDVQRALSVFLKHHITSAPLLRKVAGGPSDAWEIAGVVDVMDLGKYVLERAQGGKAPHEMKLRELLARTSKAPDAEGKEGDSPAGAGGGDGSGDSEPKPDTPSSADEGKEGDLKDDSISCTANMSSNNPTVTVSASDSLADALPLLCSGIRRALIADEKAGVVGLLSQSDILRTVAEDYDAMDAIARIPVSGMTDLRRTVCACLTTTPAVLALQSMIDNNISALALVDPDTHKMVANLSMSDIRGLAEVDRERWPEVLSKPALEWLEHMRGVGGIARSLFSDPSGDTVDRIVRVLPSDSLGTVLNMFFAAKLHRVWVTDREGKPVGLVALTDILRTFASTLDDLRKPAGDAAAE